MAKVEVDLGALSLDRLLAAVKESRKEIAKTVRTILRDGRNHGKSLIRSQFRRRTGRLFHAASAMKVSATVSGGTVDGMVSPRPRLLNIYEKGATIPAHEIAPKKGVALRFRARQEGKKRLATVFIRGRVLIPARSLAPRPVIEPTREYVEQKIGEDLRQAVDEVLGREVAR